MARLQNEVGAKYFFGATNFLTKNAPKISPIFLSLLMLWVRKLPQNSRQNSRQISLPKLKNKSPTSFCRSAGRTHEVELGHLKVGSGVFECTQDICFNFLYLVLRHVQFSYRLATEQKCSGQHAQSKIKNPVDSATSVLALAVLL